QKLRPPSGLFSWVLTSAKISFLQRREAATVHRALGNASSPFTACRWLVTIAPARGCRPFGGSVPFFRGCPTAPSTQPNTMILSVVIVPCSFGPDEGALVADCHGGVAAAVTEVTGTYQNCGSNYPAPSLAECREESCGRSSVRF